MIAGNGQPDGGSVGEGELFLHQAFSKRPRADDEATVVILNGPGDNFTGRSGRFVN